MSIDFLDPETWNEGKNFHQGTEVHDGNVNTDHGII